MLANNVNIHIDPDALALLPEDSDVSGLSSMTVDSHPDNVEVPSTQDVDPYDAHLSKTVVPMTAPRLTEQETVRQAVQDQLPEVVWPPIGETPTQQKAICNFDILLVI